VRLLALRHTGGRTALGLRKRTRSNRRSATGRRCAADPGFWRSRCPRPLPVLLSTAAAVSTDQVGAMYFYPSSESTVAWQYGGD